MNRALDVAVAAFVASMGFNFLRLPGNARLPELLFVPLVLLLLIAFFKEERRGTFSFSRLDTLVVAYLIGALPSFAATDDLEASIVELVRHGYLVGIYIAIALVTLSEHCGVVGQGFRIGALAHAAIGVGATAAFALGMSLPVDIGEVMRMPYVGDVLRLRTLTFSPTMLGAILTTTAPFVLAYALVTDGVVRGRWALVGAAIFVTMVLTFSHTIAGFLVAGLFVIWPWLPVRRSVRLGAVAGVMAVVVFFNLTLTASVRSFGYGRESVNDSIPSPYAVDSRQVRIGAARIDYEVMSYFRVKELAVEAFVAHPWTGVGLDRFHRVSEAGYQAGQLPHGYRAIDPHSALLGRLAETGIVGGVTLVGLWWAAGLAGRQALRCAGPRAWLARAAVAAFIGLLVNGVNVDIMNFRFFWVDLGLLRGLSQRINT
jgi:O-Antigen ligase